MSQSLSGRTLAVVNGVVAAALVAVLAGVASFVKPPAPPGIAEFAPKASKPVSRAPLTQTAMFGQNGPGPGGRVRSTDGPGGVAPASRPTVTGGAPSALQCYTWPNGAVTQTFDPQSPPCVASWPDSRKGNGGATSQGVDSTAIRFAVPFDVDLFTRLASFFNTKYQLYGRQIEVISAPAQAGRFRAPEDQRALALAMAEKHVFAATDYIPGAHGMETFREALAGKRVLSIAPYARAQENPETLDRLDPYAWTFAPDLRDLEESMVAWACGDLVGQPAAHAGSRLQSTTRRFAVLSQRNADTATPIPTDILTEGLRRCGAGPVRAVDFPTDATQQAQVMLDLQSAGITTIVCLTWDCAVPMPAASRIQYQPEWLLTGVLQQLAESQLQTAPPDQAPHLFGLFPEDKLLPPPLQVWHRAYNETGSASNSGDPFGETRACYHALALLAAGIQAAGPQLTPQRFATGLRSLSFPNPGAAEAPSYQASVGFNSSGHTMTRDLALAWWSPDSPSHQSGLSPRGGWCYAGRGQRFPVGSWHQGYPKPFDQTSCQ